MTTLTAVLGWVAMGFGFYSTWLLGRQRRLGWLVGVVSCALWLVVDWRLTLWSGVVAGFVQAGLTLQSWWCWKVVERWGLAGDRRSRRL